MLNGNPLIPNLEETRIKTFCLDVQLFSSLYNFFSSSFELYEDKMLLKKEWEGKYLEIILRQSGMEGG